MKRSKTSKAWMQEHVNDAYVQRAKAEGWRSRAAFKLKEIDARDHILRPGMVVVDLGAAPGSWCQVVAGKVGAKGKVFALDLLEMAPIPGVEFLQGDFHDEAFVTAFEEKLGGRPVDLVISDIAPNMSGIGSADQARAMYLCELALDFAQRHLAPGGSFLVKVFQGTGFDEFRSTMQASFRSVAVRKPDASRDRSSEVYLLGTGLKSVS
jgi:23S rRNA (uridine2552-2'-O)-methyltransferase